jgi:hypothetical protein
MRFERARAACTRCCFEGPTGPGTYPGTVAASMLEAELDECRSWLSFVDRTARQDASNNDQRKPGCLILERREQHSSLSQPPCGWRIKGLICWLAEAPPDGCACRDSHEPASNPCIACNVPVRGWALPSAGGRCSAPRSGECRSRGSGPQAREIPRSERRRGSERAAPVL